jgi:hypothetical protein
VGIEGCCCQDYYCVLFNKDSHSTATHSSWYIEYKVVCRHSSILMYQQRVQVVLEVVSLNRQMQSSSVSALTAAAAAAVVNAAAAADVFKCR